MHCQNKESFPVSIQNLVLLGVSYSIFFGSLNKSITGILPHVRCFVEIIGLKTTRSFLFTEGEINSKFFSTSMHVKGIYFTLELAGINFRKIGQNYQNTFTYK